MKSQIGNYMPNQDGTSCSFEFDQSKFQSEIFVKDLRENHGIFFDCSVSPDSPNVYDRAGRLNTKSRKQKKMSNALSFTVSPSKKLEISSKNDELYSRSFKNKSENYKIGQD